MKEQKKEVELGHVPCKCCGSVTVSEEGSYDICDVCGWEEDPSQAKHPDMSGGANSLSLNQARAAWLIRKEK